MYCIAIIEKSSGIEVVPIYEDKIFTEPKLAVRYIDEDYYLSYVWGMSHFDDEYDYGIKIKELEVVSE